MPSRYKVIATLMLALILIAGCGKGTPTATVAPPQTPPATATPSDPFALISHESLFAFMEDLTAIQPYSGWRNSASEGEAEAIDYVAKKLEGLQHLDSLGLELERQSFHVFLGTELWETRLHLTVGSQDVEVPADGLRGPRDDIAQALRFDSDGTLNDSEPNPSVVEGPVVVIRSADEIHALSQADLKDKIALLDYAVIDRVVLGDTKQAVEIAWELLDKGPAGLVLVTHFSNQQQESHGAFVGDLSALNWVETEPPIPALYVRLEDLAPAGVTSWDDLARVEAARLTLDADVFSPGTSRNLIARIPGVDPSRAVILGAHIDSPNSPGAMDDGSGSVVLLEIARVLDVARTRPQVDLYLVWFGSEEIGLYGSLHFVNTHQELLDRTLAMLQIDCLARPLDGISANLDLVTWPYSRLGDNRLTWPDYLAQAATERGVKAFPRGVLHTYSDNSTFSGFDVPNADLIYEGPAMETAGGFHYASHVHDPYDTVELAQEMGDVLKQMAQVSLVAALETGQDSPTLRVAPSPEQRALFINSHTEAVHMTPAAFTDLGMALAWEGFDVDTIPYSQGVTPADLENVALVIVSPVLDYPSSDGDATLYDEAWSQEEIDALETYVAEGGLLVLTNSAHRLKYSSVTDPNEDWSDVNALAARFGISYQEGTVSSTTAKTDGQHALVEGISTLELSEGNGVLLVQAGGQVLLQADGEPIVTLIDHGDAGGQVLALADMGILASDGNLTFWRNLARYARSR